MVAMSSGPRAAAPAYGLTNLGFDADAEAAARHVVVVWTARRGAAARVALAALAAGTPRRREATGTASRARTPAAAERRQRETSDIVEGRGGGGVVVEYECELCEVGLGSRSSLGYSLVAFLLSLWARKADSPARKKCREHAVHTRTDSDRERQGQEGGIDNYPIDHSAGSLLDQQHAGRPGTASSTSRSILIDRGTQKWYLDYFLLFIACIPAPSYDLRAVHLESSVCTFWQNRRASRSLRPYSSAATDLSGQGCLLQLASQLHTARQVESWNEQQHDMYHWRRCREEQASNATATALVLGAGCDAIATG